jgi:hypothetical protein
MAYRDEVIVLIDETEGLGEEFTSAGSLATDVATEMSSARPRIEDIAAHLGGVQRKIGELVAMFGSAGDHVDELSREASASEDTAEILVERADTILRGATSEAAEEGKTKLNAAKDAGTNGAVRVAIVKEGLGEVYRDTESLIEELGRIITQVGGITGKLDELTGLTRQASTDLTEAAAQSNDAKERFEEYLPNI